ncbi:ABC transporter ATP-binding protein [Nisaea nitritireducens]|uniref:ABC transporter ATP-binding protein n=1 Tax=Nisaea nitritireducens TaxID=568392 RepID=UPI0018689975|nr:ATP-binding cassette domain-containing protein [Nisaea nitritireducens]
MLTVRSLVRLHLGPLDLEVAAGECTALRGRSGSGKSVFLRAIADLDPSEGTVALDGRDRNTMSAPDWRRQVGYLPAEPGWWSDRVTAHFAAWSACRPMAERLGLDPEVGDLSVSRLSSGERQRLGLVRLLENRPRCLLLDEPTASLDEAATAVVEQLVAEHCEAGGSCLFVTHDPAQFKRISRQGYRLEEGKLVQETAA